MLECLDLGGGDSLFAHKCIDEPVERRDHRPGEFEAAKGVFGFLEALGEPTGDTEGRIPRGQGGRYEGVYPLATGQRAFVAARDSIHGCRDRMIGQWKIRGVTGMNSYPETFKKNEFFI